MRAVGNIDTSQLSWTEQFVLSAGAIQGGGFTDRPQTCHDLHRNRCSGGFRHVFGTEALAKLPADDRRTLLDLANTWHGRDLPIFRRIARSMRVHHRPSDQARCPPWASLRPRMTPCVLTYR
jgi:hypothetical protein